MNFSYINTVSRNPYLYAQIMKAFLGGFQKECPVRKLFVGITILEYSEARDRLVNSNRKSSFSSLFGSSSDFNGAKLDGNSRLIAFYQRYQYIYDDLKKALLLLLADHDVDFNEFKGTIKLTKFGSGDYYDMQATERLRRYQRAAKQLGQLMLRTSEETLEYYLGACFE